MNNEEQLMPEWIAITLTIPLILLVLSVVMSLLGVLFTLDIKEGIRVGLIGTAVLTGLALFIYLISLAVSAIWMSVGH